MSFTSIVYQTHSDINKNWKSIKKAFIKADDRARNLHSPDDFKKMLHQDSVRLYRVSDENGHAAWTVLRIFYYPQGSVVEGWLYSGRSSRRIEKMLIEVTEEVCEQVGAIEWRLYGRPGWNKRVLRFRPNAQIETMIRVPVINKDNKEDTP